MSIVSLLTMKLANSMRANNAEYSIMNANNQIMQGIRQAGNPNLSFTGLKELHEKEKNLMAQKHTANFVRMASNAQAESTSKMLKDSIKRSFDMYA